MGFKVSEDLVNASNEEILAKLKNREIEQPQRGTPERAEFDKFLASAPGSDERKAFLKQDDGDDGRPDESGQAPDDDLNHDGEIEEPLSGQKPDTPPSTEEETPPEEPSSSEDDDEWLGYGSKEKMVEAHKNLFKSIEQKQKEVNKLRATGGKQGRKIKDLEAQIKAQTDQMENLRKAEVGDGPAGDNEKLEKPVRPKRPNPKDYDDGEVDERYEEDLKKWEDEADAYSERLESYYDKLQKRSLSHIEDRIKKAEQRSEEAYKHVSAERDRENETATEKAWNDMWDDAKSCQESLGLQTKTPISQINDAVMDLKSSDEEAKAAAEAFIKSLPKGDYQNFQQIRDILNGGYYSFSEGRPQKAFPNLQAALWSITDSSGKPLAEKYADVVVRRKNYSNEQARVVKENFQRRKESESALPADGQGSNDKRLDSPQTSAEKMERLKVLLAMRKKNVKGFDADAKMYKEFASLTRDLGFHRGRGAGS